MSRKLLIMRHAKSSWDAAGAADFERPLSRRGRRDAPLMGRWLAERGLRPDWLVSSPAERARQTTLAVCAALGLSEDAVHWEPAVYAADLDTLLEILGGCPAQSALVMLVGHNPGLERLVRYLTGDSIPTAAILKPMPTAAIAVMRMPMDWSDLGYATAELETLMRPRTLKEA